MLNSWATVAAALPPQMAPKQRMQELREFYAEQPRQLTLLHTLGVREFPCIHESIAALAEHVVVITIDTEAWTKNTDEMTEIGLAVFERKDMVKLNKTKKDLEKDNDLKNCEYEHLGAFGEELLKKIAFHHLRIVETAHLKTNATWMKGPEGNRFGRSRFVTFAEARDIMDSLFLQPVISENPELKDCYRPVVLIGHAIGHDIKNMSKREGLQYDWNKIGTIVREIDTQPLAKATNTWNNPEAPNNEVSLETLTKTLGFEHADAHTACNDAARTIISAVQMALPQACKDSKKKDLQMVALEIEKHSRDNCISTWGTEFCCTRCGGRDHQNEHGQRCEAPVHCEACAQFDATNEEDHQATHIEMYCVHVAEYKGWLRRYNASLRKRHHISSGPPEGSHPPSGYKPLAHKHRAPYSKRSFSQSSNGHFFTGPTITGRTTSTHNAGPRNNVAGSQSSRSRRGGSNVGRGRGATRNDHEPSQNGSGLGREE